MATLALNKLQPKKDTYTNLRQVSHTVNHSFLINEFHFAVKLSSWHTCGNRVVTRDKNIEG